MYIHLICQQENFGFMKLEEEIQQVQGFQDSLEKAFLNVIYTGNWLYGNQYQFLKPFGISPEQYNILRILRGQSPNSASINLLKARMLDKMSNASRLVEKLRKKGLVEREECPDDRRCVDVTITKAGLDLLENIAQNNTGARDNYPQITEEEAGILNQILDKFRET